MVESDKSPQDNVTKPTTRRKPGDVLPVTLLSGFLGAGKTTLLTHMLRNKTGQRIAVVVNDMASVNIDAELVDGTKMVQRTEELIRLENGCICCTLRQDLVEEVSKLAKDGEVDYLVIESTGISEPLQVAETFAFSSAGSQMPAGESTNDHGHGNGQHQGHGHAHSSSSAAQPSMKGLGDLARLDTTVTVVDLKHFGEHLDSIQSVAERFARRGEEIADEDDRGISELLMDQLEVADVVILNKMDLVSKDECQRVKNIVQAVNRRAHIIITKKSEVPLHEVLDTKRFDLKHAMAVPEWLRSLSEKHTPETEEYGIGSMIYRATRPFHSGRLYAFLTAYFSLTVVGHDESGAEDSEAEDCAEEEGEEEEEAEDDAEEDVEPEPPAAKRKNVQTKSSQDAGISSKRPRLLKPEELRRELVHKQFGVLLRSKGFIWLANVKNFRVVWQQTGGCLSLTTGMPWDSALAPEDREQPCSEVASMLPANTHKDNTFGDKRQELVFIGQNVKKDALFAALDGCLLSEEEVAKGEASWKDLVGDDLAELRPGATAPAVQ